MTARGRVRDHSRPGIGMRAPSYRNMSSRGEITFPEQYAGKWVILFGHVEDFIPINNAELFELETINKEFSDNNCSIIALYEGDPRHLIEKYSVLKTVRSPIVKIQQSLSVTIVDDRSGDVARRFGILNMPSESPDDMRIFYIIDPAGFIRTILVYHPESIKQHYKDILGVVIALKKSDTIVRDGDHDIARPLRAFNRVALSV